MAIKPVEILIKAKDEASGVFGLLKKNAVELGVTIAGYFGIKTFVGAVQGAAEFEAKLSEVRAVTQGSAADMALLRKAAEDAGATTKYSATEAADALGNLARAGLTSQQAIAALPATLQLAQAGQVDLAAAADFVTQGLVAFRLEASEAGRVADVLALGANASKTSVTGLGQALSYAAPTAVSLGLSLETTVAIIGKFADAGIDASRAGTALNAILSQFSDPASRFRKELSAIGIVTTDFEQALRQMAAAGPAAEKAILAVGTEAGPALRGGLNLGIAALDDLKSKLEGAAGSAKDFATIVEDNTTGAASGLASAWDTVKLTLATPVLPVLKDGIQQLTAALRGAVESGTVGKFGDALARGFQAALTWAQRFLAEVDVDALAARMASAADRVGQAFDSAAEYARNAGNVVQTAWGVMSAGANTVLAVVYTVGEAFAGVASNIQSGVALILQGLSKITFGDISASFKASAEDMRLSAEATWSASEALSQKAGEALSAVADGAQLARDGWAGLTEDTGAATSQADVAARAFAQVGETLRELGGDAEAAGMKAQAAAVLQTEAAKQVQQEVRVMREEYEAALKAGDVQTALEKLDQMKKALSGVGQKAGETKDAIAAAFTAAGIKTRQELESIAATALKEFNLIKQSGEATPEGLAAAWKRYAEAAIAANGGVASELLKSQAETYGLEIAVDKAGKAIVRAMGEGENATSKFRGGLKEAAGEVQGLMAWLDRLEKRNAAVKSVLITDKDGFAVDAGGKRITQTVDNRDSAASKLEDLGLDAETAASLAKRVFDDRGNYTPRSSGAFREGDTLDALLARLAKQQGAAKTGRGSLITYEDGSQSFDFNDEMRKNVEAGRHPWDNGGDQSYRKVGAESGSGASVGRTVRVELVTARGVEVVNTDDAGAAAMVRGMQSASLSARG